MESKLGLEGAFPFEVVKVRNGGEAAITKWESEKGMSKRFYAACAAMQGILASPSYSKQAFDISNTGNTYVQYPYEQICKTAYMIADELLKQERV